MRRFLLLGWVLSACTSSTPASSVEPSAGPELVPTVPLADSEAEPSDAPPEPPPAVAFDATAVPPPSYPFQEPLPDVSELMRGAAMRLANLAPSTCLAQISKEGVPFKRVGKADSIAAPLRITGPLGEVNFRVPPEKTPFGLIDCRLALTLQEIVPVLREHQIKAMRIDSFYRPRAKLPAGKGKKSQHAYALAADVVSVTLDDGRELDIERDFHGAIGQPVCGPDAYMEPVSDEAVRLRNLVCDLARRGAFHHMLTPNHDQAHRNHLHLDIKRDNKWFSID